MNELAPIYPIMEKYGVTCAPTEFHSIVNLEFHSAESQVYDSVHRPMWESLPEQMQLLTGAIGPLPEKLTVLDIGCGTGLASELLLQTPIGKKIAEIHLLDTCQDMLDRAKKRSANWNIPVRPILGDIRSVAAQNQKYQLIITCSVLHHIPNLEEFTRSVRSLQSDRAYFLHLQDPNGDFADDADLKARMAEYTQSRQPVLPKAITKLSPKNIVGKLQRTIKGERDYIEQFNEKLLSTRVIAKPMLPTDIWAITDIHVHHGNGISIRNLEGYMPEYQLVSKRSYCFFGAQHSELPEPFKSRDRQLIQSGALNGHAVGCLWKLNVSGVDGAESGSKFRN